MEQTIYQKGDHLLIQTNEFGKDIIEILDGIVWGEESEGAKYEHKDTETQLKRIVSPIISKYYNKGILQAFCVYIHRRVRSGSFESDVYFIRYLNVLPQYRGSGILTVAAGRTMQYMRRTIPENSVFVGIVEKANKRSYRTVRFAKMFEYSTIRTLNFSRAFPKRDKRAAELSEDDQPQLIAKLNEFYKDYSFWHTENLLRGWRYFVIKEKGEIVAGVQAYPAHWVIRNLPGPMGKFILKAAPYIPIINSMFNPNNYRFLGFDYIYYKEGHLMDLQKLLSSVLVEFKLKSGLFWFDSKSPHAKEIEQKMRFGLLHRFGSGNDSFIMAGFENMSEENEELLKSMPAFQSSGDFI